MYVNPTQFELRRAPSDRPTGRRLLSSKLFRAPYLYNLTICEGQVPLITVFAFLLAFSTSRKKFGYSCDVNSYNNYLLLYFQIPIEKKYNCIFFIFKLNILLFCIQLYKLNYWLHKCKILWIVVGIRQLKRRSRVPVIFWANETLYGIRF